MIHAVAVLSRSGKLLLARQYTHETRDQIEGHLGAFPKLVTNSGHAYIDTESVRFVYQEIGELYIVLVVSKDSNICEDLDAVALLVDVTGQIAGSFNDESIIAKGIDIIYAYDECVFDGFRQNLTAADVNKFLKMQSQEEDMFNKIRAEKEARAAEERKRKIQEFNEKKQGGAPGISGIIKSFTGMTNAASQPMPTPHVSLDVEPPVSKPVRRAKGGGMDLTRSTRSKAQQVMAEEGLVTESAAKPTVKEYHASSSGDMRVLIQEKFTAAISRMGSVKELAVEGRLVAGCGKHIGVNLQVDGDLKTSKYRYKVMQQPRGNLWQEQKKLVYDNRIGKYSPGTDVTLLCWRMTSTDENDLPIAISCWVTQTQQTSTFSVEVELKQEGFKCDTIIICIPAHGRGLEVSHCDGNTEIFERDGYIKWTIEDLSDDNARAELEFAVPACEEDSFFPVTVGFESSETICDLTVTELEPLDDDEEAPALSVTKRCITHKFEIE